MVHNSKQAIRASHALLVGTIAVCAFAHASCTRGGTAREVQTVAPLAARLTVDNRIELRTTRVNASGMTEVVHQSLDYEPDAAISDVTLDPSANFVALRLASPGSDTAPISSRLVVLDRSGTQVYTNNQYVPVHAWADSSTLFEVEGRAVEGGVGFHFEAAYLTSPISGRRTRVEVPGIPRSVTWAEFDGALYLETLFPANGALVFRLATSSGSFEPTTHHDIHFSPTGRYYYHEPDEGDPVARVYMTSTDTEVAHPALTGNVVGWADEGGDLLVIAPARRAAERGLPTTHQLLEPASGQIREITGAPTGWVTPGGRIQLSR